MKRYFILLIISIIICGSIKNVNALKSSSSFSSFKFKGEIVPIPPEILDPGKEKPVDEIIQGYRKPWLVSAQPITSENWFKMLASKKIPKNDKSTGAQQNADVDDIFKLAKNIEDPYFERNWLLILSLLIFILFIIPFSAIAFLIKRINILSLKINEL